MNYVEKVFDGFHYYFFDLNAATLSGAIDVVAIPQEGGELRCTPFHVRFGKLQLLRSTEKVVTIIVNDVETPVVMKVRPSPQLTCAPRPHATSPPPLFVSLRPDAASPSPSPCARLPPSSHRPPVRPSDSPRSSVVQVRRTL